MISVLDSGAGNLQSALNALKKLDVEAISITEPELVANSTKIPIHGVGSWGAVMSLLRERDFDKALKEAISSGKQYFGICMGLQVLFEKSEEDAGEGLGVFQGEVVRFKTRKVPQIGWNYAEKAREGIVESNYYYFINSFHVKPRREEIITAGTNYMGEDFVAAVQRDNVTAVQFHPEKSAAAGLELLRRWAKS